MSVLVCVDLGCILFALGSLDEDINRCAWDSSSVRVAHNAAELRDDFDVG